MESKGLGNVLTKLLKIQCELKVPKNKYSDFGKYHFRSCEDILEAVKPICEKYGCVITVYDEILMVGDRYYVRSSATIFDIESEESFVSSASAREEEKKDRMDQSQTTGSASSYARKYALNGLLAIDDAADPDALNDATHEEKKKASVPQNSTQYAQKSTQSATQSATQKATVKFISEAQRKRLFSLGREEDIRAVLPLYGIESTKEITTAMYDDICKRVEEMKKNAK